jgi:hypothetical protein
MLARAARTAARRVEAASCEAALAAALRACSYCPEYAKAHHRVVRAVKAGARGQFAAKIRGQDLGGELVDSRPILGDLLDTATSIQQMIMLFEGASSVALALFCTGQISLPMLAARQEWHLRRLLEDERPRSLHLSFSLVPCTVAGHGGFPEATPENARRGQWLMLGLSYGGFPDAFGSYGSTKHDMVRDFPVPFPYSPISYVQNPWFWIGRLPMQILYGGPGLTEDLVGAA